MRDFTTITSLAIVVAVAMSVLIVSTAPQAMTLDGPAVSALHEHDAASEGGAPVNGDHASGCNHHTSGLDCFSCPACSGILASGRVALVAHLSNAASEYTSRLEQVVLRRELPPPKHA